MPTAIRIPRKVSGSSRYPPKGAGTIMPSTDIAAPGSGLAAAAAAAAPPQTLQQRAQAELDPMLKRITDAITARARAAGQAITGYTNSYAGDLGKIDYGAPYAPGIAQQAAVDSSLAQALAGGGLSEAEGLKTRLAQIGEPGVVNQAADRVAQAGTGNSNTVLAAGSSNLGALIANAAAAKSYGQKLPGIARLAGLQDLTSANQGAQTQIADKTASIESQLPGLINTLRSQQTTRNQNAATNKYRDKTLGLSEKKTKAALILANGIDPATGTLTPQASKALTKLLGVTGMTGVSDSSAASYARNKETAAHHQVTESQGATRVAQGGERIAISRENAQTSRLRQQAAAEKTKTGGITAATYSGLKKEALSKADLFYYGKVVKNAAGETDPDRTIYGVDYPVALKQLMHGYSLTRQDAATILNDFYAPGERGRPAASVNPAVNPKLAGPVKR